MKRLLLIAVFVMLSSPLLWAEECSHNRTIQNEKETLVWCADCGEVLIDKSPYSICHFILKDILWEYKGKTYHDFKSLIKKVLSEIEEERINLNAPLPIP